MHEHLTNRELNNIIVLVMNMNIIQSHIYYGDHIGQDESQLPIYVRSCGHLYNIDRVYNNCRMDGRDDYQIIFVSGGCLYIGEDNTPIPAGSIIVYKPGEPQIYRRNANEGTEYYWIHFSGSGAKDLLESVGLCDKNCYYNMDFVEFMPVIYKIMSEIRLKRKNFEMQCACYLTELLNNVCRANFTTEYTESDYKELFPALNAMELQLKNNYTLDDYADMCCMSKSKFTHMFKDCIGQSPMQYKNSVMMEQAKYFLTHSDMTVGEVSREIGIADSLYFSKKFHAYTGLTPRDYRRKYRKV